LNNLFNLGYEMLSWKVHRALINARLEPFLGFVHSIQYGKPSLVCDFQELYRYLIDDFLMRLKMGKRIHLCEFETNELADDLNLFFNRMVEIPRIKVGKRQTIETLISEEALLLAKYLRDEYNLWIPRIPLL